ncbi:ATP-binding protein [Kitasatospora purpeofusca]|uniref:ATP-binding protein n=1 Tax=Kitasatospora purpeofusca TaxID=67352 RepID=UPI003655D29F
MQVLQVQLEVGPDPAEVGRARRWARSRLVGSGIGDDEPLAETLILLISELVTNAVKHAALLSPELAVEVAIAADWVRVSVEDNHPYRPTALETDYAQTGGRGLLLVKVITAEAGGTCDVEHTASGGKIIWAALPLKTQL